MLPFNYHTQIKDLLDKKILEFSINKPNESKLLFLDETDAKNSLKKTKICRIDVPFLTFSELILKDNSDTYKNIIQIEDKMQDIVRNLDSSEQIIEELLSNEIVITY